MTDYTFIPLSYFVRAAEIVRWRFENIGRWTGYGLATSWYTEGCNSSYHLGR